MRRTPPLCHLVVLALLAACAVSPPPKTTWSPASESTPAFAEAREACAQRAMSETKTAHGETLASKAAFGIFLECMKAKGWTMSQEAAPRP